MSYPVTGHEVFVSLNLSNTMLTGIGRGTITRETVSVDYLKELFRQHTNEALVAIIKGLRCRMAERKTRSSRAEATMKRARDMLHGELSVALELPLSEVEGYIQSRIGPQ